MNNANYKKQDDYREVKERERRDSKKEALNEEETKARFRNPILEEEFRAWKQEFSGLEERRKPKAWEWVRNMRVDFWDVYYFSFILILVTFFISSWLLVSYHFGTTPEERLERELCQRSCVVDINN